jgi:hypothetical protein
MFHIVRLRGTYIALTKLYKSKTGKEPLYAIMPQVVISGPKLSRDTL